MLPTLLLHYVVPPDGLLGIYIETGQPDKFYYTYTDYLGSITEITDGTVVEEMSYDAWGRRRNPSDWTYSVPINQPWPGLFDRGYTGHSLSREERCGKHLDAFGLINMNGRMYDPILGLMLSPDNYVSDASSTVAFNRFLYANGNPMKYTDPSGEIVWFVPILIGAAVGILTNGIENSINHRPFFQGAGKAALIGGVSGAFSFGIGQAAMGMSGIAKVGFQMAAHGHLGGIMTFMNGGTYGQGFLSGAAGSLIGGGTSSLLQNAGAGWQALGTVGAGALAGGVGAEIMGGNFWDGARNGAISAGLNHFAHKAFYDAQLKKMYNVYKKSVEDYPTPEEFYKSIGGPLGDWAAESPEQFENTCAARLSMALNYGGFEIPEGTSGAYLGGDGKYYFINAKAMSTYLSNTKVWGMPNQARSYSNVRNAVISQTGFTGGVTGHLDIIYRGMPANHIYQTTTFYWH